MLPCEIWAFSWLCLNFVSETEEQFNDPSPFEKGKRQSGGLRGPYFTARRALTWVMESLRAAATAGPAGPSLEKDGFLRAGRNLRTHGRWKSRCKFPR